jgi:fimbrial chaperone protein
MKTVKSTLIITFVMLISKSMSGQIAINPTLISLSKDSLIQEISLENQGGEKMLFETSVKAWTQKDNDNNYQETTDVIILPITASLEPKTKQKFRVVLQKPPKEPVEQAYRVFFTETPQASKFEKGGLKFLLNFSVPLFAHGEKFSPSENKAWSAKTLPDGKRISLSLTNTGNQYFVVRDLEVTGKSTFSSNTMHYLLAKITHVWDLPIDAQKKIDQLKINYVVQERKEAINLSLLPKKKLLNQNK